MLIIGLGNKARHGKNYAAKCMLAHAAAHGVYGKEYGFADALKAYCRVAFGMRKKDAPLLQYVGTDIFRKKDPDVWVRVLLDTIEDQQPDLAIITDVRFPNEANAVRAAGGKLVHVSRLNEDGSHYVAPDRDPLHLSETALDAYTFDYHITAESGNVAHLRKSSETVLDDIWERSYAHSGV